MATHELTPPALIVLLDEPNFLEGLATASDAFSAEGYQGPLSEEEIMQLIAANLNKRAMKASFSTWEKPTCLYHLGYVLGIIEQGLKS